MRTSSDPTCAKHLDQVGPGGAVQHLAHGEDAPPGGETLVVAQRTLRQKALGEHQHQRHRAQHDREPARAPRASAARSWRRRRWRRRARRGGSRRRRGTARRAGPSPSRRRARDRSTRSASRGRRARPAPAGADASDRRPRSRPHASRCAPSLPSWPLNARAPHRASDSRGHPTRNCHRNVNVGLTRRRRDAPFRDRRRPAAPPASRPSRAASSTRTRIAEDRFAGPRSASISSTRRWIERPRAAASVRSPSQNGASSDMLVRWPATERERFVTRASAVTADLRIPCGRGAPSAGRDRRFPFL